jgi:hypothetical protein
MNFWWASQNKNYRTAIPNGTLWTRPRVNGVLPRERAALQELRPDDIVFHYGAPFIRAVSRVVAPAIESKRPTDYPRGPRETEADDDGKLVRVELVTDDLHLHRDRIAELIEWGTPGPLTRRGIPREAYLSPLTEADATSLLEELAVAIPMQSLPGRPHENWPFGRGDTDAHSMVRIRREQGALRAHLLAERRSAPCAICGRDIDAELLVAGHIVPRAELTEEERYDFEGAAMLVCLFGCDALFENGYVVVDETGLVRGGRPSDSRIIQDEVATRAGTASAGWNQTRAGAYRAHFERHSVDQVL